MTCPGCGGSDRFQFNRRSDSGAFSCRHHPDGGGDGFDLLMHVLDCDFKTAAKQVAAALGLADGEQAYRPITPPSVPPAIDWLKKREKAAAIWHAGKAITADDPAGRYLTRRGLNLPNCADALRYHPALDYWTQGDGDQPEFIGRPPALVARILRSDGMAAGLHRIYLESDGRKFDHNGLPAKKIFKAGELVGAAVRLGKPDEDRLAIAEGIETAMAFSQLTGVCTWAALSSSLMPGVWLPDQIKRVYIAADNDEAGRKAAEKLAGRLLDTGRAVWINTPEGCSDWNDRLIALEVRHAA